MKPFIALLIVLGMSQPALVRAAAPTPAVPPGAAATAVPAPAGWTRQVTASLTLNQASFSNWAQGGTDMVSWQAGLNARAQDDTRAANWLNTLKLQYGLTYLADKGTQVSADTIDLESVYSWKTWPEVNPFVSLSVQTQFGPGYDYSASPAAEISDFLDPGYFTESAGLKYVPGPAFNTRVGLGVKETVADRFRVPYTVDPGTGRASGELTQLGLSWVSELNVKFLGNSSLDSKLDTFWPGGSLDLTVAEWDNQLGFTLNKLFSLNLEGDLRYDSRVYDGVQFKETLGLGLAYSLL